MDQDTERAPWERYLSDTDAEVLSHLRSAAAVERPGSDAYASIASKLDALRRRGEVALAREISDDSPGTLYGRALSFSEVRRSGLHAVRELATLRRGQTFGRAGTPSAWVALKQSWARLAQLNRGTAQRAPDPVSPTENPIDVRESFSVAFSEMWDAGRQVDEAREVSGILADDHPTVRAFVTSAGKVAEAYKALSETEPDGTAHMPEAAEKAFSALQGHLFTEPAGDTGTLNRDPRLERTVELGIRTVQAEKIDRINEYLFGQGDPRALYETLLLEQELERTLAHVSEAITAGPGAVERTAADGGDGREGGPLSEQDVRALEGLEPLEEASVRLFDLGFSKFEGKNIRFSRARLTDGSDLVVMASGQEVRLLHQSDAGNQLNQIHAVNFGDMTTDRYRLAGELQPGDLMNLSQAMLAIAGKTEAFLRQSGCVVEQDSRRSLEDMAGDVYRAAMGGEKTREAAAGHARIDGREPGTAGAEPAPLVDRGEEAAVVLYPTRGEGNYSWERLQRLAREDGVKVDLVDDIHHPLHGRAVLSVVDRVSREVIEFASPAAMLAYGRERTPGENASADRLLEQAADLAVEKTPDLIRGQHQRAVARDVEDRVAAEHERGIHPMPEEALGGEGPLPERQTAGMETGAAIQAERAGDTPDPARAGTRSAGVEGDRAKTDLEPGHEEAETAVERRRKVIHGHSFFGAGGADRASFRALYLYRPEDELHRVYEGLPKLIAAEFGSAEPAKTDEVKTEEHQRFSAALAGMALIEDVMIERGMIDRNQARYRETARQRSQQLTPGTVQ